MRIPILDRSAGLRHGVVLPELQQGPADLAEMKMPAFADLLKPLMTFHGARWIMNHSSPFMFRPEFMWAPRVL